MSDILNKNSRQGVVYFLNNPPATTRPAMPTHFLNPRIPPPPPRANMVKGDGDALRAINRFVVNFNGGGGGAEDVTDGEGARGRVRSRLICRRPVNWNCFWCFCCC